MELVIKQRWTGKDNTMQKICTGLILALLMLSGISAQTGETPDEKTPPWEGSVAGTSFTLGGGYFTPSGSTANILKPSWVGILSARSYNLSDTLFGLGADFSYAGLKDKKYSSGKMNYVTFVPYATAAFSFFELFDITGRAGAGLTWLMSKVNNESNSDVSFTLTAGGGIARVFSKNFVIGIEADYNYYMQRHTSASIYGMMYLGYKL
jgi:opacity protein-like surface antigen